MGESERYWYKEAVIYSLDVRSFKDGDGNGTGDFKGLLEKFDYLIELGSYLFMDFAFLPF